MAFFHTVGLDSFGLADVCYRLKIDPSKEFTEQEYVSIGQESVKTCKETSRGSFEVPGIGVLRYGASLLEITPSKEIASCLSLFCSVVGGTEQCPILAKSDLPPKLKFVHVTQIPKQAQKTLKPASVCGKWFSQHDVNGFKNDENSVSD